MWANSLGSLDSTLDFFVVEASENLNLSTVYCKCWLLKNSGQILFCFASPLNFSGCRGGSVSHLYTVCPVSCVKGLDGDFFPFWHCPVSYVGVLRDVCLTDWLCPLYKKRYLCSFVSFFICPGSGSSPPPPPSSPRANEKRKDGSLYVLLHAHGKLHYGLRRGMISSSRKWLQLFQYKVGPISGVIWMIGRRLLLLLLLLDVVVVSGGGGRGSRNVFSVFQNVCLFVGVNWVERESNLKIEFWRLVVIIRRWAGLRGETGMVIIWERWSFGHKSWRGL